MSLNYADYGYTLKHLGEIITGGFLFNPQIPISKKSCFSSTEWDWTDEHNGRLKVVNDCKVCFNWDEVTIGTEACQRAALRNHHQRFLPVLPKEMVEDIKRAFFIYSMFPSLVPSRGKRSRGTLKAISVVSHIRRAVNFFSHVYLRTMIGGIGIIRKLSDITVRDIQKAIVTYPYRVDEVKNILAFLGNEYISTNLKYGKLKWNNLDLKNLDWPEEKERENIEPLPDYLFRLLSNKSSNLIGEFLFLMGIELRDSQAGQATREDRKLRWPRFREMFASYIERRNIIRLKDARYTANHTASFVLEFGVTPEELKDFLFDVQCAAQNIILLYTGMRYSDAAMLHVGCLVQREGIYLIKSSLIKNRPSNLPIDEDEWVAIDIAQDAIHALEELSRCTFNRFLFSNFETIKVGKKEDPLSNSGLTQRLNKFLDRVDTEGNWTGWTLSPHQYRHGLIYQLARAEVGIPYITRQLHHYYSLLSERDNKVNETSLIYGMQMDRLVRNATGLNALKDARYEIIQDLYGEGRKFAGGGAALHVERTEAFFQGIGLEGSARRAYLEEFAKSGVVVIRTGVGWCIRNHVDPQKLKNAPPPCIGDLQCNPHTCKYSVVPESRKSEVIRNYLNALKKINSPSQAFLKAHWEAERDSYAAMLRQLGIDPDKLSKEDR